jgi:hypothetical protein
MSASGRFFGEGVSLALYLQLVSISKNGVVV